MMNRSYQQTVLQLHYGRYQMCEANRYYVNARKCLQQLGNPYQQNPMQQISQVVMEEVVIDMFRETVNEVSMDGNVFYFIQQDILRLYVRSYNRCQRSM